MWRVLRRLLAGVGLLLLAAIVTGIVYQWLSTRRQIAQHPPPGHLVDVGGHRLHIWCAGTGSPTVLLESGLGGSSTDWGFVQPSVAEFTRVCAYDRAGLGYSDPGPMPRTTERIVRELGVLVDRAGITAPIVLVGASLGGFSARVFASIHPDRTAGVVLVDSSHEDQTMDVPQLARFAPVLASLGIFRLLGVSFTWDPDSVAPAVREYARATQYRTSVYSAAASEVRYARSSAGQVRATRRKLSVPVVVVTGGRGNDGQWKALQLDQLQLSTSSCQLIAERSGHAVPMGQPEAVARAIRIVVDVVRGRSERPICE